MKDFYRVMLGRGSMYIDVCRQKGFIGAHFGIDQDLTGFLGDDPREFNQRVRPIYLAAFPEKSKGSASLSCGYLYETEESGGQQFPTDTGPIDLLAISKDKQELLVVELKRGRASDAVVGQIQRYMGYVLEEIAEDHQRVRGVIIALDDDKRIRRALQIAQGIDFYRYEVKFNLIPAS